MHVTQSATIAQQIVSLVESTDVSTDEPITAQALEILQSEAPLGKISAKTFSKISIKIGQIDKPEDQQRIQALFSLKFGTKKDALNSLQEVLVSGKNYDLIEKFAQKLPPSMRIQALITTKSSEPQEGRLAAAKTLLHGVKLTATQALPLLIDPAFKGKENKEFIAQHLKTKKNYFFGKKVTILHADDLPKALGKRIKSQTLIMHIENATSALQEAEKNKTIEDILSFIDPIPQRTADALLSKDIVCDAALKTASPTPLANWALSSDALETKKRLQLIKNNNPQRWEAILKSWKKPGQLSKFYAHFAQDMMQPISNRPQTFAEAKRYLEELGYEKEAASLSDKVDLLKGSTFAFVLKALANYGLSDTEKALRSLFTFAGKLDALSDAGKLDAFSELGMDRNVMFQYMQKEMLKNPSHYLTQMNNDDVPIEDLKKIFPIEKREFKKAFDTFCSVKTPDRQRTILYLFALGVVARNNLPQDMPTDEKKLLEQTIEALLERQDDKPIPDGDLKELFGKFQNTHLNLTYKRNDINRRLAKLFEH